jgi:hypothetical protein
MLGPPLRNLAIALVFVVAVFIVATSGYVAAGWTLADALYMLTLTIFSVGYGEVRPIDTPFLHELTIAMIVLGCTEETTLRSAGIDRARVLDTLAPVAGAAADCAATAFQQSLKPIYRAKCGVSPISLGVDVAPDAWLTLVEHCTFDYMKEKANEVAPIGATFMAGGRQAFFHKGTNGRRREVLSVEESRKYEDMAAAKLTPDFAHWLATGERSD